MMFSYSGDLLCICEKYSYLFCTIKPWTRPYYLCTVLLSVIADLMSSLLRNIAIYSVPLSRVLFKGDVL